MSRGRKREKLTPTQAEHTSPILEHPRKANAKKDDQYHQQAGEGLRGVVNWKAALKNLPRKTKKWTRKSSWDLRTMGWKLLQRLQQDFQKTRHGMAGQQYSRRAPLRIFQN